PGSETLLGTVLKKNNIRDKVNIATKIPHYLINSVSGAEKIYQEQISRLQTDTIDYYLLHMLTDEANLERMKQLGIMDWLEEKKKAGAVKNIGFSYHGNTEHFLKILEGYDWDFCQIQYNYIDETTQAGVRGLKAAAQKGIPVIIMEPLRGGKLVNLLPAEARKAMEENKRGWSPAAWAFRWLYNQPEVAVVLSGMNSTEMVNENIETANTAVAGELDKDDFAFLEKIKDYIRAGEKVGCTGCGYCMPCPKGVDIPANFRFYNAMYSEGKNEARTKFIQNVGLSKQPPFATQCIGCGKCEKHCPQCLPIREKLKEADKALRPLPWKIGISVVRALILRGDKNKNK
ncbi:MAG: aldo/keto reductase, partial [Clostridia bacterium]|nr:aldo/keto reductase [Clostridia bacterium]